MLSLYMYWGPGAFLPIFSFLVSSLTKILQPSHRLAWGNEYWAWDFSTDMGNLPKEVWACSESRAWANAVKSNQTEERQRQKSLVTSHHNTREIFENRVCHWKNVVIVDIVAFQTPEDMSMHHKWGSLMGGIVRTCESKRLIGLLLLILLLFSHGFLSKICCFLFKN